MSTSSSGSESSNQSTGFPPSVVLEPLAAHTHTIIFLHGRGSSAREFCEDLGLSDAENIDFLRRAAALEMGPALRREALFHRHETAAEGVV